MTQSHGGLHPRVGVQIISGRSLAEQTHHAQVGDCVAVPAPGGLPVPDFSALVISGDSAVRMIGQADQELGAQAAGLGGTQEAVESIGIVRSVQCAVEIGRGMMGALVHVTP